MKQRITTILLVLLTATIAFSAIDISGHARVRPRFDTLDWGTIGNDGLQSKTDIYYWYRVRLDFKADIGDNWFFKTSLGHNGPDYFIGKFSSAPYGTGGKAYTSYSMNNSYRATVDWMEVYFGHSGEKAGFQMGVIPIKHNVALDIHFYPNMPIDLPWLIWNNSSTGGFSVYHNVFGGKLNTYLTVDENRTEWLNQAEDFTNTEYEFNTETGEIDTTVTSTYAGEVSNYDTYSLGLDYSFELAGHKIQPMFWKTFATGNLAAPITYGGTFSAPKIFGLDLSFSGAFTDQRVETTETYHGWIVRPMAKGKLGPGSFVIWYDKANIEYNEKTYKIGDEEVIHIGVPEKYGYLWAHYKWVAHKSDFGEFSVKPTLRITTIDIPEVKSYRRTTFEITAEIRF